jgi:hypothetical protein
MCKSSGTTTSCCGPLAHGPDGDFTPSQLHFDLGSDDGSIAPSQSASQAISRDGFGGRVFHDAREVPHLFHAVVERFAEREPLETAGVREWVASFPCGCVQPGLDH